jgi:DNA topoisomerase-1
MFTGPDGKPVKDKETLKRIHSLVIPPAWTQVWICPSPNGHLQAVGRDARGRKQYRYHPQYRTVRDQTKFHRMREFGRVLPQIRKQVEQDLALPGLSRRKVLATVVKLLDETSIRVGNEEYAQSNDSYGLTTMRDQHVEVTGGKMHFKFRGKSGQMHDIEVNDRRLAKIVKSCQDIPGQELFQYIDENGQPGLIDSTDVNDYLREITGGEFTAKDFRTWTGTGHALGALRRLGPASSVTEAKRNIVAAVKETAARLGNRPATCRKYYVHPAVLESYQSGGLFELKVEEVMHGLHGEEPLVLTLTAVGTISVTLGKERA